MFYTNKKNGSILRCMGSTCSCRRFRHCPYHSSSRVVCQCVSFWNCPFHLSSRVMYASVCRFGVDEVDLFICVQGEDGVYWGTLMQCGAMRVQTSTVVYVCLCLHAAYTWTGRPHGDPLPIYQKLDITATTDKPQLGSILPQQI